MPDKVQVKLEFKADAAQARGEMAATRREVEKLGVESRKTQQEMARMGGHGSGGTPGGTPGSGAGGGASGLMSGLARATGALMAFRQVIEGTSKAMASYYSNKYENRTMGAIAEGGNSLLGGIPQWAVDQYKGIRFSRSKADMDEAYRREDIFSVRRPVEATIAQQNRGFIEQRASASDRHEAAIAGANTSKWWAGKFGTEPGQTDPRLRGLLEAGESARTGAVVGERADARALLGVNRADQSLTEAKNKAFQERLRLGKMGDAPASKYTEEQLRMMPFMRQSGGESGGDNSFKRQSQEAEVRKANLEVLIREKDLREAIEGKHKTGLELEQKRSELRKASLNYSKAELEIAREREGKAKSQAADFGMMSGSDKLALKYGLQQAQSQGIDALPEETRQLLARSGLTGEFAQRESERSVQDDPVYQSIVQALGGKTSRQSTTERLAIETKVELNSDIDTRELAEGLRVQWDQYLEKMKPLMEEISLQQLKIVLNQRKQVEK